MSDQINNKSEDQDSTIESQAVEVDQKSAQNQTKTNKTTNSKTATFNNEVITRILVTLLFALIGWLSLWVFGVVVLVQFGFLLITGGLNKNLKAFNGELGEFLSDIIAYVGFQKDEKPFPFKGWHYDDKKSTPNKEATEQ